MSDITPNLNMILGGIQIAQLPGAAAVSLFNLIYEHRELAHTHAGFEKICELRPLAQAINVRLTPNAPRLQAAGAKTELRFSPFEALSMFHIIGASITLRQTELSFVTGRIATAATHDEDEGPLADVTDDEVVDALHAQLNSAQLALLFDKLPVEDVVPATTEDYELAQAILDFHGVDAVVAQLNALEIPFTMPELDDEDAAFEDETPGLEGELVAEIQDQLPDEQIDSLIREFITEEDEDDEQDILLDLIVQRHGVQAVIQKIDDLGFNFSSELDEDFPDDEEDGGFVEGAESPEGDDEDEMEDRIERLERLDIQDLEILCDVLGINRVGQDHDGLIQLLAQADETALTSAFEITDIAVPTLDYEDDEPTVAEYRANFSHIAALTMLQSAVASCIADSTQDLVLSFTH